MMGSLIISISEPLLTLVIASMIMWGPVFGFAYATRRFGDSIGTYAKAYLGVCLLTLMSLLLFAVTHNAFH